MSETTGTTSTTKAPTLADILKAQDALNRMRFTKEWTLISNTGQMWQGSPVELLQVLMPLHPLMQPLSFGEMTRTTT